MRHIAAYALLVLGGKDAPTAADVEKVVKDAGAPADSDKIKALVEALAGKEFHELVSTGMKTLSSMGSAQPAAAAAGGAAVAKVEVVEEEPEEDVDMGDLFGGGDDDY
jgi:large subunit ribosomal protein LP2